jgi:hypothetical protein
MSALYRVRSTECRLTAALSFLLPSALCTLFSVPEVC